MTCLNIKVEVEIAVHVGISNEFKSQSRLTIDISMHHCVTFISFWWSMERLTGIEWICLCVYLHWHFNSFKSHISKWFLIELYLQSVTIGTRSFWIFGVDQCVPLSIKFELLNFNADKFNFSTEKTLQSFKQDSSHYAFGGQLFYVQFLQRFFTG